MEKTETYKKTTTSKILGNYYSTIHVLLIVGIGTIALFSNNITHLFYIAIVVFLDILAIVFCHDCPLTLLEEKYMQNSKKRERTKSLKNMGICYNCSHDYESQLEMVINNLLLIVGKIIAMIALRYFGIRY